MLLWDFLQWRSVLRSLGLGGMCYHPPHGACNHQQGGASSPTKGGERQRIGNCSLRLLRRHMDQPQLHVSAPLQALCNHSSITHFFCSVPPYLDIYYVMWLFLGRDKHLLTPDRTLTTDQRNDSIKIQLGEPVSLLGLHKRVWVSSYSRGTDDAAGAD